LNIPGAAEPDLDATSEFEAGAGVEFSARPDSVLEAEAGAELERDSESEL